MTSTFRDVLVTPYSDLLLVGPQRLVHRGGPHWPDFESQYEARHQRRGECVDDEPEWQASQHRLEDRWAWAGPICAHFGHQLLEFSTRLVPTLAEDRDARFLFAVPPSGRFGSIDETPRFFRELLEWFGIHPSRCHVVTAPTVVDDLSVVPQSEQLGGPGPSESHLDVMDALTYRRLGLPERRDVVYVSRAGLSARFCGEALLEDALVACGVHVVRPETLPLAQQLEAYASARLLIFAEGSAMYGPILLGRTLAEVVVLTRRPGWRLANKSLSPRARSLRYFDAIEELVPGRNWRGESVEFAGLTILDDEMLLGVFDSLDIPVRRHWDARRYADCRTEDLQAHRS
jgi:Glycosyltransferase 61